MQNVCAFCQLKVAAPHRFRVARLDEECFCNQILSIELMRVNGKSVPSIIGRDKKLGKAHFLSDKLASDSLEPFPET